MSQENQKRYDEVPYESKPYQLSHPSWLASVAAVFGMDAPKPDGARILELGCASGGNLIPMAESLPRSSCIGIDLSERQIADGRSFLATTGLTNVELKQASILDVNDSYGEFDYVICHGVFSWVDRNLQQKILELCSKRLSARGIAYVSYNTYPGWHMKEMLRDMMRFHASRFKTPKAQIAQSRALLNVLARTIPSEDNPFGMLLKQESEVLQRRSDSYIYHEHLELENDPVYFHEFAQRANDVGLQFLGESELRAMLTSQLSPEIQAALREVATSLVFAEQYMDFFRNRTFRQTLLCRSSVGLNRKLNAETFKSFSFASALKPQTDITDVKDAVPVKFTAPDFPTATVSQENAKVTLMCLQEAWPEYVPLAELENRVRIRLGLPLANETYSADFLDTMGTWFTQGLVKITRFRPCCVSTVSDKPVASAVARAQVAATKRAVTNLLHANIAISEFEARVLSLLDGTMDRTALAASLQITSPSGVSGQPLPEGESVPMLEQLDNTLRKLAYVGLLRG